MYSRLQSFVVEQWMDLLSQHIWITASIYNKKTNVKKLNEGDESKIDNLFKHEALEYKNSVPAGLQFLILF